MSTRQDECRRDFARRFSHVNPPGHIEEMRQLVGRSVREDFNWARLRDLIDLIGLVRNKWGPHKTFPTPVDAYADMLKSFRAAFPRARFGGKFTQVGDRVYVLGVLDSLHGGGQVVMSVPLYPDWEAIFMTEAEYVEAVVVFLSECEG